MPGAFGGRELPDSVLNFWGAVGAVAGASVPVALMAIGSLGLALPYFASKALLDGSNRLLQHAGVPERNLETLKNFVLFVETLTSGKEFVVKPPEAAVSTVTPKIDLAKRLQQCKLVEGPKELGYKDRVLHWFGTHGIGSFYLVPVAKDETGHCKYVEATVLRERFGFSRSETHRISNMTPVEAVAMCTKLYAKKEEARQSLIDECANILKTPINTFTKREFRNICNTYYDKGFLPGDLLQDAYKSLDIGQQEHSQGMYQLWLIAIKNDTEHEGALGSDCEVGVNWAKKEGCYDQFIQRLQEINPRLAEHFKTRDVLIHMVAKKYVDILQLPEEQKKKLFLLRDEETACYKQIQNYGLREEFDDIIGKAFIQAAKKVNPDNPQQVLTDLKSLFETKIENIDHLEDPRWVEHQFRLTLLRTMQARIPERIE